MLSARTAVQQPVSQLTRRRLIESIRRVPFGPASGLIVSQAVKTYTGDRIDKQLCVTHYFIPKIRKFTAYIGKAIRNN